MAFCTIGVSKQKGGNVGSSSRHNDRDRETPNADPERTPLNRVLVGDDRNARYRVREIIDEHGGKPRRDSVEAVELLLSASHEYFVGRDGEVDPERLERWVGQATKFLNDRGNCGICAKAVLHLDERTPHIHAHMVPITEAGRLSATHFLDGKAKMKELHTRHAAYMKELGLERGREVSRATHQRVKQFYASVDREPELKIEPDRIPDPSRLKVLTAEGARAYKLEVLSHVLEQIKEPVQILQDQSQLTRNERAHRVEADKRADEAERQAQERIEAAEREAQEKIAAVRREEAERFENLLRSARQISEEKQELEREKDAMLQEREKLREALGLLLRTKLDLQALAKEYSDRLTDIPMEEVMQCLGYDGERHGEVLVYHADGGQVAMLIEKQKAFDHRKELICKNSLDLVVHMRRENEGMKGFDRNDALAWLQARSAPTAHTSPTESSLRWSSSGVGTRSASRRAHSSVSTQTTRGAGREGGLRTVIEVHATTTRATTEAPVLAGSHDRRVTNAATQRSNLLVILSRKIFSTLRQDIAICLTVSLTIRSAGMNSTFFSSLSRLKFGVRLLLLAAVCAFGFGLSRSTRAQMAPQADLTVTKSGDETVPVGGTITYNLVVINGGPDDAVNVVLTDPLPAHTTFVSASTSQGSVAFSNNTLTVSFGTIPAFESGSATLVVSVNGDTPRGTTISNTATATADTADPDSENNSSTAQTAVTGPFAGDLLISEFRLRGPGGPSDEFVEVYNNGDAPQTVNATDGSDGYAVAASDGVVRCTIPNGTVIPARGHFLCVNSAGYSLAAYPSGVNATVAGDATYTTNISDNAGIALFRTANPSNFNTVTRLDAAGSASESNSLYREGTGYPALSGAAYTSGLNYSFLRDQCGKGGSTTAPGACPTMGFPKDTDNNAADFIFVDTAGTSAGAGQRLGAPGPEDLSAPPQSNSQVSLPNLDTTVGASAPPNRVRDFTPVNPNTSSNGTLEIRRRVVNNTGLAVSRLRFRVIDITTFPTPSGFADLRPITSTATLVSGINDTATCAGAGPCTVFVEGTTLEQPPSQPSGGGFNSSLSVDVVTLDTPLQPGESINIRFLLGVQKSGTFRFFVNIEALSFDPNEVPEELQSRPQTGGVVRRR